MRAPSRICSARKSLARRSHSEHDRQPLPPCEGKHGGEPADGEAELELSDREDPERAERRSLTRSHILEGVSTCIDHGSMWSRATHLLNDDEPASLVEDPNESRAGEAAEAEKEVLRETTTGVAVG
jgi:hypothetical protein